MALPLPLPPTGVPFLDLNNQVNEPWRRYFLQLQTAVATSGAPTDAQYWVSTANAQLTNERNIGLLLTGYLKITTAIGVATPSTTTTIPTTDLSGVLGALQFPALTGDVTTVAGTLATTLAVPTASNTYTPTLTNVANVAASTPYVCQYMRVGSTVTVGGKVDIDPSSATTLTQLGISLPIASTFAATENCGGSAAAPAVAGYSAGILADAVNHRAELDFTTAADVANRSWYFSFTYRII